MTIQNLIFSSLLFLGPFLSLSSSHWFLVWAGMEMTVVGFLPLLFNNSLSYSVESSLLYFLVQASASSILLMGGIWVFYLYESIEMNIVVFLMLLLKLGLFPFHFWVVPVMSKLTYLQIFVISSPMKIIPLSIMCLLMPSQLIIIFFFFSSFISMMLGSILGLNFTNMRYVLAVSSISHSGWLFMNSVTGGLLVYFLIYSFTILSATLSLFLQLPFLSFLSLMSLSGLPPFFMFFAKLNSLLTWSFYWDNYLLLLIPIVSAVVSLFFYLKLATFFYLSSNNGKMSIMSSLFLFLHVFGGVVLVLI